MQKTIKAEELTMNLKSELLYGCIHPITKHAHLQVALDPVFWDEEESKSNRFHSTRIDGWWGESTIKVSCGVHGNKETGIWDSSCVGV